MTNHVHLIFRSQSETTPGQILGDFKKFTSKKIITAIQDNSKESRKENLIAAFAKAGQKNSNVTKYQFWRQDNKPIELWSKKVTEEKIRYVHHNPAEAGLVYRPEDYMFSSAIDYAGEKGQLDGVVIY